MRTTQFNEVAFAHRARAYSVVIAVSTSRQELDAPPARPRLRCQAVLAGMLPQA
jgi:hypothetical protein